MAGIVARTIFAVLQPRTRHALIACSDFSLLVASVTDSIVFVLGNLGTLQCWVIRCRLARWHGGACAPSCMTCGAKCHAKKGTQPVRQLKQNQERAFTKGSCFRDPSAKRTHKGIIFKEVPLRRPARATFISCDSGGAVRCLVNQSDTGIVSSQ